MKAAAIGLLVLGTTLACTIAVRSSAQDTDHIPTFKGHHLGETFAEFLAVDRSYSAFLAECHKKWPDADFGNPCRGMLEAEKGRGGFTQAEVGPGPSVYVPLFPRIIPKGPSWAFQDGKLVLIILHVPAPYSQVFSDMNAKLGTSGTESKATMQNALGATWVNRAAAWDTPLLHATMVENNNPADPDLMVRITSHALWKAEQEAADKEKAKSSLD